jgi:hypothetical protein
MAQSVTPRWKPTPDPEATSPVPIPGWTVIGGKPKTKRRPKVTTILKPEVSPRRKPTNPYGIK